MLWAANAGHERSARAHVDLVPVSRCGKRAKGGKSAGRGSLAACANIMPVMQSIYSWQDEIHEAQEVGVLFKSNVQAHSRCMTRLLALHPYSEPAILAWECPASLPQTIGWLAKLVG
jgi:periplasmic divalent cation tolerance protein